MTAGSASRAYSQIWMNCGPPISAATKQATATAHLTCTDGIWAALITIDLHYN